MNPMMSWFLPWQSERDPGDVPALWDFAEQIVCQNPDQVDPDLFQRCLQVHCVSPTNLTMGMFWMRPDTYLALDSRNKNRLDQTDIAHDVADWASYLEFLDRLPSQVREKPYEFSRGAYIGSEPAISYWIFQCSPKYYDLVGALNAVPSIDWQVNQHKKEVKPGDKVIIWMTGDQPGCYALATATTEVRLQPGSEEQDPYWIGDEKEKDTERVNLKIDVNLADYPILKQEITSNRRLKGLKAGQQGTNIPATEEQYTEFVKMANARRGVRYWMYAPGENAMHWGKFYDAGIMALGWDKLGDLRTHSTKESLQKELKKVYGYETEPSNSALALWEFVHVLKPGDVVIAKQGRQAYLGYGIVSGPYEHDPRGEDYPNVRRVAWKKKGTWSSGGFKIVTKTLTDVTKYPDYLEELKQLLGINEETRSTDKQPLNTILYGPPGTGKTWSLRNQYMPRFVEEAAAVSKEDFATKLVETGERQLHSDINDNYTSTFGRF